MAVVRRIGAASCAVAMLLARVAHGQEAGPKDADGTRFHLFYQAPAGCPDRGAFAGAIHDRTSRPRLVDDDATAITLRVVIEARPEGASGRLVLRDPDGTEETRSVASRTCGEVSDALALVAAVMLDPDARTNNEPPRKPEQKPPEPAPPPASSQAPPPKPAGPRPTPALPRVEPKARWIFAAGLELGIASGIGPAIAPKGGAFGDVERRWPTGLTSSLRVSLDAAATSSALRSGSQTYEWLGATVRLCPAHFELPAHLRVAPCAGLQTAGHRGTTRDVRSPTARTELWLAPVASGTVDWAVTPAVSLEVQGGILLPLRRSRYFLAPASTIFEVPVAAATAGVGVRVRFL